MVVLTMTVFVVIAFGGMSAHMCSRYIYTTNKNYLKNSVLEQSRALQDSFTNQFSMLDVFSKDLTISWTDDTVELTSRLDSIRQSSLTDFSFVAYVDKNYRALYNTGDTRSLVNNAQCKSAMGGLKTMGSVENAMLDNNRYLVFYVPVEAPDGKSFQGVVMAGCKLEVFENVISQALATETSCSIICEKDGTVIMSDINADKLNASGNILTVISETNVSDEKFEELKANLLNTKS